MATKTIVQSAVQKFLDISPIHGCSYIASRKEAWETILWILVLMGCFSMCIRDTLKLVRTYRSGATAASVRMQSDYSLQVKDAAFCFDIARQGIDIGLTQDFNETSFNQTIAQLATLMRNSSFDLSTLPLYDPEWDMIMKATYVGLALIIDYDVGVPNGWGISLSNLTQRAGNLMLDFFAFQNVDYSMLVDQTARYLCKQLTNPQLQTCPFQYLTEYTSPCIDLCSNGKLTWFGITATFSYDDACFSLSNDNISLFANAYAAIEVSSVAITQPSLLVSFWNTTLLADQLITPQLYFDMRGWEGIVDVRSADSIIASPAKTSSQVGVAFASRFLALNRTAKICAPISRASCTLQCLLNERIETDGCFPLAANSLVNTKPSEMPFCTRVFTDDEVDAILNNSDGYQNKLDVCFNTTCSIAPCDLITYEFKVSPAATDTGISVILYQGKFVYPIMEEYLIMNSNEFLSNFGGTIGLWFGGSLIALVHIPVYFAMFCASLLHKHFKKNVKIRQKITSMFVVPHFASFTPQNQTRSKSTVNM